MLNTIVFGSNFLLLREMYHTGIQDCFQEGIHIHWLENKEVQFKTSPLLLNSLRNLEIEHHEIALVHSPVAMELPTLALLT